MGPEYGKSKFLLHFTHALSTMQNLPFVCNAESRSLFGILVVTGAPAQTSGEQHFIELAIAQN
jgi:hypothetical protein